VWLTPNPRDLNQPEGERWRDGSSPYTPYRRKNLAEITNRAIANFVPNFVAMATGVGQGKIRLVAFDDPSL